MMQPNLDHIIQILQQLGIVVIQKYNKKREKVFMIIDPRTGLYNVYTEQQIYDDTASCIVCGGDAGSINLEQVKFYGICSGCLDNNPNYPRIVKEKLGYKEARDDQSCEEEDREDYGFEEEEDYNDTDDEGPQWDPTWN